MIFACIFERAVVFLREITRGVTFAYAGAHAFSFRHRLFLSRRVQ